MEGCPLRRNNSAYLCDRVPDFRASHQDGRYGAIYVLEKLKALVGEVTKGLSAARKNTEEGE